MAQAIQAIEAQRQAILREMDAIRSVVRGTFKEQMLPVPHQNKKEPVMRGPYYLLAKWEQGKTHSRRISPEEAPAIKQGAENYKRLKELCEQFAVLTERLGEIEREQGVSVETLKKKPKSLRKPRRK